MIDETLMGQFYIQSKAPFCDYLLVVLKQSGI